MSCENELVLFEEANQTALNSYEAEESAAVAATEAADGLLSAQEALATATQNLADAENAQLTATQTADDASIAAGNAYVAYLDCQREADETIEPMTVNMFFLQKRRR